MGAAATGIVELLKLGGPYATMVLAIAWGCFERWRNVKTTDMVISLATSHIEHVTEVKALLIAQDKSLTMVLSRGRGR